MQRFLANRDASPQTLPGVNIHDHLCVLSGVTGSFEDHDAARAAMSFWSEQWQIVGWNNASSNSNTGQMVIAETFCANVSDFSDTTASPSWTLEQNDEETLHGGSAGTHVLFDQLSSLWPAAVSHIEGYFHSGGDYVRVINDPLYPNAQLQLGNYANDPLTGATIRFGVDSPNNGTPQYSERSSNGVVLGHTWRLHTRMTGGYTGSYTNGDVQIDRQLAPTREAFCFLTHIGDEFESQDESVRLEQRAGYWYLSVSSEDPLIDSVKGAGHK